MSRFLLDTNVISELIKPRPAPKVTTWIESIDEDLLFISVLTLGEIRKGLEMIPHQAKRIAIEAWLEKGIKDRFEGRILEIDEAIADRWGAISGQAQSKGHPISVIDGLLAATALHHNLTMVTRNEKNFTNTDTTIFNPWRL